MVRDVFQLTRERALCVVFIDEIDAIWKKRSDYQIGRTSRCRIFWGVSDADGRVRIHGNGKIVMATNRANTLDPALLRPGRLDKKSKFTTWMPRRGRGYSKYT